MSFKKKKKVIWINHKTFLMTKIFLKANRKLGAHSERKNKKNGVGLSVFLVFGLKFVPNLNLSLLWIVLNLFFLKKYN